MRAYRDSLLAAGCLVLARSWGLPNLTKQAGSPLDLGGFLVFSENEVIFDVVTRDALLILNGKIHRLDGPFQSREHAHEAAEQMKRRLAEPDQQREARRN